jgi:hypothetical protein
MSLLRTIALSLTIWSILGTAPARAETVAQAYGQALKQY